MNKYPKIGIRPTIDGRQGGVRECLEEKTMALANAVKELIEKNVSSPTLPSVVLPRALLVLRSSNARV